jgi:hypothetical protein
MVERTACVRCGNPILETTARKNTGLCAICKSEADRVASDAVIQGWIKDPTTLPGTHGIPLPNDIGLSIAARQLKKRLYPDDDAKLDAECHAAFNQAQDKWLSQGAAALSNRERYTLAVETFYGEVSNGGFEQYLTNESGEFAPWAEEAFAAIGIPELAEVMRNLADLFPEGTIPVDADDRLEHILSIDGERLEELASRFFAFERSDENRLHRKLADYLRRTPS